MISVVCVYNDELLVNDYLLKSLKDQNVEYELILVNNVEGRFKSAAEALNYGGSQATCDFIMFVHQDMDISGETWLQDAETMLKSLDNMGIAGLSGCNKEKVWAVTNLKDGIPPEFVSPERIYNPVKVQTLDECLIVIPKHIFEILKFDAVVCDDWHLYAADYCLSVQKLGYDVYVIPLYAYHRSRAFSLSEGYYTTLKKLLKKHASSYKYILLMDDWLTFYPLSIQRRFPFMRNVFVYVLRRL